MGYTSEHRERGLTDRDFWQGALDKRYRILDCATVNRSTFYAAVQDTETGTVAAFVALQQWTPASYYNFTHKGMSETYGPNEASCPARILDLLTPLGECPRMHPLREYDYCGACAAREWRASCREVADNRERAAKVKPGQVVKFAKPVTFASGLKLDTFYFVTRDTFLGFDNPYRYRITGWRTMTGWELVTS